MPSRDERRIAPRPRPLAERSRTGIGDSNSKPPTSLRYVLFGTSAGSQEDRGLRKIAGYIAASREHGGWPLFRGAFDMSARSGVFRAKMMASDDAPHMRRAARHLSRGGAPAECLHPRLLRLRQGEMARVQTLPVEIMLLRAVPFNPDKVSYWRAP